MFRNIIALVLLCALIFAECTAPLEPTVKNYATNFDYAQELQLSADCLKNSNEGLKAITYYNKAISEFKNALNELGTGTDFELRAGVYTKIAACYQKLSEVDPTNAAEYNSKVSENQVFAQSERNKISDYWIYLAVGGGLLLIFVAMFLLFFRKKKYPEEYTRFTPSGKAINVDLPQKKEPQKIIEQKTVEIPRVQTTNTFDPSIKDKYKEKLRKKFGL